MKQKRTIILLLILLLELSFFALCGKLCHTQTPAPEPAAGNLMMENWKNRQGIFVELTDSTSAVDNQIRLMELPYNTAEPANAWPIDTVKTTDDFPNVLITTHGFVYLWQQYKAECYAGSEIYSWEVLCFDSTNSDTIYGKVTPLKRPKNDPTVEGFFDWLEGRMK